MDHANSLSVCLSVLLACLLPCLLAPGGPPGAGWEHERTQLCSWLSFADLGSLSETRGGCP